MYSSYSSEMADEMAKEIAEREETFLIVSVVFGIIVFIIAFLINVLFAMQFYNAAKAKGHYQSRYLWLCLFFGLPGYLLVIALPDRNPIGVNQIPYQNGVNYGYQPPYQM